MQCKVAKMRDALDLVKPTMPRKPKIEVMENVLLGNGQIIGGDLENAIIVALPEADESILMPFESVSQMLKFIPGNELVTMKVKRGKLTITWSEGEASYSATKPEEYPPLPDLHETSRADLPGDSLVAAIKSVLPYTSSDVARPVLQGITVVFSEGNIQVAAGDGFRLAYENIPLAYPEIRTIILPPHGAALFLHLWGKTPRTPPPSDVLVPTVITAKKMIAVALTEEVIRVDFGGTASLVSKLIQGSPPDWLKLIPTTEPVLRARMLAPDLERAVRRLSEVARSSSNIVRLEFEDKQLKVSAKGEGGEISAKLDLIDCEGEPNRVALSVPYLLNYLSDKTSIVTLSLTGGSAPVLLEHRASPRVIVMPMNVQW